jgi:hypothetical protein
VPADAARGAIDTAAAAAPAAARHRQIDRFAVINVMRLLLVIDGWAV